MSYCMLSSYFLTGKPSWGPAALDLAQLTASPSYLNLGLFSQGRQPAWIRLAVEHIYAVLVLNMFSTKGGEKGRQ